MTVNRTYQKYAYPEEFAGVRVITQPYCLPVTIEEVKRAARTCDTAHDAYLMALAMSSTVYAQRLQNRSLITQTLKQTLDCWLPELTLLYPRLQSVTSIKYLDTAGDQQTLAADQYTVDTNSEPGRIFRAPYISWPSLYGSPSQIEITYAAGYEEVAGELTAGIAAGAVTSITLDGVVGSPPVQGVLYVVNSSGQSETCNYTAYGFDGTTYTLTVDRTFIYAYAEDDTINILTVPETTRQGIIAAAVHLFEHPGEKSQVLLYNNRPVNALLTMEAIEEL